MVVLDEDIRLGKIKAGITGSPTRPPPRRRTAIRMSRAQSKPSLFGVSIWFDALALLRSSVGSPPQMSLISWPDPRGA